MNFGYDKRCASRGGASDSSQMSNVLSHDYYVAVQEEECVKEEAGAALDAVPFADTKDSVIAIINGKLVNSEEILESDILVEGGKITKIEKNLEIPEGAKVIDAQDRFVLPGGVDYGTRILSREFTDSDGVAERTKSFILGGITTIVDSIQSDDFEKSFEVLKVLKDSENGFYCDLSVKLHVPECNDETEAVIEKSATEFGVRSFHVSPEKVSDEELMELGRVVAGVGGVLCVDAVTGSEDTLTPAEDIEEGLVRRVCSLAHQVDVTVYFLNVMYSSTLELVSEFQEKGLRVYADLLTDLESLKELPLDGDNRLLASKSRGKPTQDESGDESEDWMSLLYTELVLPEKLDISRFVDLTSSNPAKLLNLYPSKGCLQVDSDADIVIWDPMRSSTLTPSTSSAFNFGKEIDVFGVPEFVLLGGTVIVADSQLRGINCLGSLLAPPPHSATERESTRLAVQRSDRPGCPSQEVKKKPWDKKKCASQGEIFAKEMGIHQRPLSAHGVRNQNDSTFSTFY